MADEPAQASNTDKQLLLQKIYIKDMSFESPLAPEIFSRNAQATTNLNIGSKNRKLDDDHVEVSLTLTIESKDGDKTLFLIEVVQSGIFTIRGYSDQESQILLGSFCPGTLYPFAREAVAEIASKGGFPQLLLQPINFDAVYAQAIQQQAATQEQQPITVNEVTASTGGNGQEGGETH
jgi:preprotein translocase subunit SecB